MESERLSVIAGQLGTVRARLDQLAARPELDTTIRAELQGLQHLLQELTDLARQEARSRLADALRLDEMLDVLSAIAGLDFSKRASVGDEGHVLDALAATINLLAEELAATQQALADRNRALEAATAAKSDFLANISHEIRTPLGALLGFAELLSDPLMSERDRAGYGQIMRRNGEHLLGLINDLLDFSKIEAGRLSLERIDCSLGALLTDIEALMRMRAPAGVACSVELAGPLPAQFRSDPTRLRQILINLVGNALKFTPAGSVRLRVGYEAAAPAALRFEVIDTGIGMDEAQQSRLFRPFEQVDASMTRRFGGTGLGLAICKPLAEALGGELSVQSTLGQGSVFCLRLIAELPPAVLWINDLSDASLRAVAELAPQTGRLSGSVLLAEDGPDNQLFFSTVLRQRGLQVTVAENGQIAVEQALAASQSEAAYDVILMDMQMPVLDGYSATRELRRQGYTGPIVALTAHAAAGEREKCLDAGCDDHLSKPVPRQRLYELLAALLPASAPVPAAGPKPAAPLPQAPRAELHGEEPLYSTYAHEAEMAGLIERFVASLPGRIEELQESSDPAALARLAHQLRGAAGGYGFMPISEAAARLETALSQGEPAETCLNQLIALCARARSGRKA